MAATELSAALFDELEQYIDSMPSTKGELIRVLHKTQSIFGYLPEEVQRFVGKKMGVSTAKVFGVVSFYSYFTMEPKGDNPIAICMGTACYVRGAEVALRRDVRGAGTARRPQRAEGLPAGCV